MDLSRPETALSPTLDGAVLVVLAGTTRPLTGREVSRGDGNTSSDIDVLVVRPEAVEEGDPAWQGQCDDLTMCIQRWTGNHAGIAELSEGALARLRQDEPPIVAELRADAITLHGVPIAALLGPSR